MAQREHYLEIDYRGWGYAGELCPDTLAQPVAEATISVESHPVPHGPSLQQRVAALLAQNFVDLDPGHKIWLFTGFACGLVVMMALLAVFIVTH
jgi:hypothetical protein